MVAFDNYPTHWLIIDLFKGGATRADNGLLFRAYPRTNSSLAEIGPPRYRGKKTGRRQAGGIFATSTPAKNKQSVKQLTFLI